MSDVRRRTAEAVRAVAPALRGRLAETAPLADFTWFRVGGPAQFLFSPADTDDLSTLLAGLPRGVPVTPLGLGSNVIIRDGGLAGVVVRLGGKAFSSVETLPGHRLDVGAAVPDARIAQAAAKAGIAGLSFYRGVPGALGGALVMNAGAYGGETKDVVVEARAVDRSGAKRAFPVSALGYSYRHSDLEEEVIFTGAVLQGRPGDPKALEDEMERIMAQREASQPIREKTGGSTFKNPPGLKAWQLIDTAGCRGLTIGGAQMSEKHCNFLINTGAATAADIEALGEEVRRRVLAQSGVRLDWEIRRIGEPA